MDSKDMITLFVPILFNGVILFVFQKMMDIKFQEESTRKQLKKQAAQEYFRKFQQLYHNIEDAYSEKEEMLKNEGCNPAELEEEIQEIKQDCARLNFYYETYKKILDKKGILQAKHKEIEKITETEYNKIEESLDIYEDLRSVMIEMNKQIIEVLF